jgi:hypothetical protein
MDVLKKEKFSISRTMIRLITSWNFLIFVMFVVPPAHRWVDRRFLELRSIQLEHVVGRALQLWLLGSTLAVTGLLGYVLWRKRKASSAGIASVPVMIEALLVAVWWLIVLGASAYGFMLGMGG